MEWVANVNEWNSSKCERMEWVASVNEWNRGSDCKFGIPLNQVHESICT